MTLVPLIAVAALFMLMMYFLMIRPVRQREHRHDEMVDELQRGDIVITAGGMYGKVESIEEDSIILKVESGATVRVTKGGVVKREEDQDIRELIG